MSDQKSYFNSIPYLIFLIILIFLFFKGNDDVNNKKSNLEIRIVSFCFFLIFFGLRGHIYSDWYSYYPKFESLPTLWNGDIMQALTIGDMEPGFILYSILIKSFFSNYFVWVFINTAIDLFILDKIFKKYTKYYVLAFIVFFIFSGILIEFNLYRNSKAIILFLYSLKYFRSKNFTAYLLLNLIGITFHYSAILFIPLYFILNKKINHWIVWLIFSVSNIVFLFHFKWINLILGDAIGILNINTILDKLSIHSENSTEAIFSLGYFERVISFLIFTFYYKKLVEHNEINKIFYNMYLLYFIFILNLSEISTFSERFSLLFMPSYWVLYPSILAILKNKQKKYIFLVIFLGYGFVRTHMANINPLARYDNLLWGIEDFDNRKKDFLNYTP